MSREATTKLNWVNILWFAAFTIMVIVYLVMISYVVSWMYQTRDEMRTRVANPQTHQDWQAWRDDIQQQQSKESIEERGPVARKVPNPTAPIFTLMEEHFVTMLIAALIASSLLYALLVFLVKGMLTRVHLPQDATSKPPHSAADEPADQGTS